MESLSRLPDFHPSSAASPSLAPQQQEDCGRVPARSATAVGKGLVLVSRSSGLQGDAPIKASGAHRNRQQLHRAMGRL